MLKKVALITGASRGIGYAIATFFASRGMDLILLARHEEGLDRAKRLINAAHPECRISTFAVDMRCTSDVEHYMDLIDQAFPSISILVNSAGILRLGGSATNSTELIELLTINLTSTLIITNRIARQMKVSRQGHIFTIASLAGLENKSTLAAYAASKAGLISYSEALYNELLPFNISVTCLCPSVVNTDMTNDGRINNEDKIQVEDVVAALRYVLSLGETAVVPRLVIRNKTMDAEKQ